MGFFQNKVVVVTGTGSGIGRALALDLAKRGAALAISDINEETLEETTRLAEAAGADVLSEVVDVADREAVFNHAEQVYDRFGRADVVFNNAGVTVSDTVADMSLEDLEWVMNINFWGVVYGTRAFLPSMLERNYGHIVNISSVFGFMGVPTQSAYNASKFAVRGFTEALRQELADTHVRASCVHPGGIKTNIVRSSRFRQGTAGATNRDEAIAQFDKIARTSPEKAAAIILRGTAHGHSRILVGPDAHLIDKMVRLFPVTYEKIMAGLSKFSP